jgi:site-specific DNA recombinase
VAPAIITEDEHKAVIERLNANQAAATRNNKDPEATLLRAGFIYCGHCGNRLTVARHTKSGASYRCDWGTAARHNCPRPTILAHMIDPVVWDVVAKILKDPDTIAQEVARSRDDGSLVRELATLDRMLAQITDKQGRIARRVASIDDEDVAAPLMAELHELAQQKKAIEAERGDLKHRIDDAEADATQLRTMTEWCQSVASNIDALTYAERRMALSGLGVSVRVWKPNTLNEQGQPNPRWQIDLAPAFGPSPARLVLGTACAGAS